MKRLLLLIAAMGCAPRSAVPGRSLDAAWSDESRAELIRLLEQLDRDRDGRVTAKDSRDGTAAALRFEADIHGRRIAVDGPERLSELTQLLAWSVVAGAALYEEALDDSRAARIRRIARGSWDPLTRRADNLDDLLRVLRASRLKSADGKLYVYFPESDPEARARLTAEHAKLTDPPVALVALPPRLDADWYERLDRHPGLLYLPHPYLVPGGHFDEMYGWDTYFMARGAMADGRFDLALTMLENLVYQIEHYGKIGNSNRSYHRGRSQPPFLGALAVGVIRAMPPGAERDSLIRRVVQAGERELREIWLSPPRITQSGLSLYRDEWNGPLPEASGKYYKVWRGEDPEFRAHQRSVRESGWDMTLRFGERGHRTVPVCLNALLYGYERDLAELYRQVDGAASPDAARLEAAAQSRREKISELMWDAERGLFFDWDIDRSARNDYEHLGSYYALFVGLASEEQARRIAQRLPSFEMPGGLAVSSERSRRAAAGEQLQWDWPYGWAPHQILAVEGLRRYGFHAEADRISVAWLSMIIDVAGANNGLIKEKYDVVARTADVPVEYGNQGGDRGAFARYPAGCGGADKRCIPQLTLTDLSSRAIGFGWTNASVSLLLDGLSDGAKQRLEGQAPAWKRTFPR